MKTLLEMTKSKAIREVEIAQHLFFQDKHKNTDEEDITYFSSEWANSIDPRYYQTRRFDKFLTIIDHNYEAFSQYRFAKQARLTDYTYEVIQQATELPRGYFVGNEEKKKMMKKYGKNYTITPLRDDLFDVMDDAINNPSKYFKKNPAHSAAYLELMKLWIDDSACLVAHLTLRGERKTYYTPSLQQAPKELRDFLLKSTGYCDVDAKASFNHDFHHLLNEYGFDTLDPKHYLTLLMYLGKDSRSIYSGVGITKQEHLAMLFGGKTMKEKFIKAFSEDRWNTLQEARQAFTEILYKDEDFQNLQGFDKEIDEWNYYDYGKALSRILNRIETKKMIAYGTKFGEMGYNIMCWCYDGLILDKTPSKEEMVAINEWYEENFWTSPLTIKKTWE